MQTWCINLHTKTKEDLKGQFSEYFFTSRFALRILPWILPGGPGTLLHFFCFEVMAALQHARFQLLAYLVRCVYFMYVFIILSVLFLSFIYLFIILLFFVIFILPGLEGPASLRRAALPSSAAVGLGAPPVFFSFYFGLAWA